MNLKISLQDWVNENINSTGGLVVEQISKTSLGKSYPLDSAVFGVGISPEVKTMLGHYFEKECYRKEYFRGKSVVGSIKKQIDLYEPFIEALKRRADIENVIFRSAVQLGKRSALLRDHEFIKGLVEASNRVSQKQEPTHVFFNGVEMKKLRPEPQDVRYRFGNM